MTSDDLVLIANAGDATISAFALGGDALRPLATTALPGSCSTFAVDGARDLVYAGIKAGPGADEPQILTLALDRASGTLAERSRRPAGGPPTFLELTRDGSVLLGASYAAGRGFAWPVRDGVLGEPASEVSFANLHCVRASADGRFAYVVSLGDNRVAQYALDAAGALTPLDPPTEDAPEGCGPRHLILDAEGTSAYVVTEFSGEVIRYARDPRTGRLTREEAVSIVDREAGLRHSRLGADPTAEHLIWGADLHLARGGQFLLASERSASTLATVDLASGGHLNEVIALRPTEAQPRGFAVTPDGTRVVAVGERSTFAALYRVTPTGELTDLDRAETGAGANWVRVLPARPAHDDLARAALQQAGDAIIVIDHTGTIREWNEHCVKLFGFTREQALGSDVTMMIPERLREAHERAFSRAMATGHLASDGHPRRTKALTGDGGNVYVTMTFAVVNGASGPAIGSVAVAREYVKEA